MFKAIRGFWPAKGQTWAEHRDALIRATNQVAPGWDMQTRFPSQIHTQIIDTEQMKHELEQEAIQSILAEVDVETLKEEIIRRALEQLNLPTLMSKISALTAQKEQR